MWWDYCECGILNSNLYKIIKKKLDLISFWHALIELHFTILKDKLKDYILS